LEINFDPHVGNPPPRSSTFVLQAPFLNKEGVSSAFPAAANAPFEQSVVVI
jgi:hypothetical protein